MNLNRRNLIMLAAAIGFAAGPATAFAADVLNAGARGPDPAEWVLWDQPNPFGQGGVNGPYTVGDAKSRGATEICVLVADNLHAVTPGTGNCLPIPADVLA